MDRTNNILEQFFGDCKRNLRRRLGRAHLSRDLEQQPAQAVLVSNLKSKEYVRILCGSLGDLPSTFAKLENNALIIPKPVIREHPKKKLQVVIRKLLKDNDNNFYSQQTELSPPLIQLKSEDISAKLQKLQNLSIDELKIRCQQMFILPLTTNTKAHDPRLPPPGTTLERIYKDRTYKVKVLEHSFEYQNECFNSISGVVAKITGTCDNGYSFFRLHNPWNGGCLAPNPKLRDLRLPPPGTTLKRLYKGRTHKVVVLEYGFEYQNEYFNSISGVVAKITGTCDNGYSFFRLYNPWNGGCLATNPKLRDLRLPPAGTTLKRLYKGRTHKVVVLEYGFKYRKKYYNSISAVEQKITGFRNNGYKFFRLSQPWSDNRENTSSYYCSDTHSGQEELCN